jgi:hypothetical protein
MIHWTHRNLATGVSLPEDTEEILKLQAENDVLKVLARSFASVLQNLTARTSTYGKSAIRVAFCTIEKWS